MDKDLNFLKSLDISDKLLDCLSAEQARYLVLLLQERHISPHEQREFSIKAISAVKRKHPEVIYMLLYSSISISQIKELPRDKLESLHEILLSHPWDFDAHLRSYLIDAQSKNTAKGEDVNRALKLKFS